MFFVFNIIEKIKKIYYYKQFFQFSYALAGVGKIADTSQNIDNNLIMHRRGDDLPPKRSRPRSSRPTSNNTKQIDPSNYRARLRESKREADTKVRKFRNKIKRENPFGELARNKEALEKIEKQLHKEDEALSHLLTFRDSPWNTGKAETEAYLKSAAKITDGQGIFSRNLQIIAIIVIAIMVLVFTVGNYLNRRNPITPLLKNPEKPFTINILDKNNTKIMTLSSQTENNVKIEEVSPSLIKALLALHTILDIKYGDHPVKTKDGDLVTLDGIVPQNINPDDTSKKVTSSDCVLYTELKQFNRANCKYSYSNFLINNFSKASETDNSFISRFIDSYDWLRNYLLEDWVKDNVDITTFLNIFFNYVYYGYNSLGLHATSLKLFSIPANALEPYQAIIIIKSIYDNNKNLYPKDAITYENIIDVMIKNGGLNPEDKPIVLEQIRNFHPPITQTPILNYFDEIFKEAYKYFRNVPIANVKSTFITSVQNTALSVTIEQMKLKKIPNASLIISNKGDIVTSFTISLDEEGKPVFHKEYPTVHAYNTLKPLLYLSLFENKKDTAHPLLENKYQNLIYAKFRREKFKTLDPIDAIANQTALAGIPGKKGTSATNNNVAPNNMATNNNAAATSNNQNTSTAANAPVATDNSKLTDEEKAKKIPIELLTKTNLDVVPANIRELFADRLYNLEKEYLLSLTPQDYKNTIQKLGLHVDFQTMEDVFNGKMAIKFDELTKFYDAIAQNGIVHEYRTIELINNDVKFANTNYDISIEPPFVTTLTSLFLGKLENRSSRVTYNTLEDYNTGVALSPDYTITVWLGNMANPLEVKDYTKQILAIILQLTSMLQ